MPITQVEVGQVAAQCDQMLNLANPPARRGTLQSLPLCMIEAVFSINSTYKATGQHRPEILSGSQHPLERPAKTTPNRRPVLDY